MAYTLYIRPVLIPIFASAFIAGGAFTAALRAQPGYESPPMSQQGMGDPSALEPASYYSVDNTYGNGPVPDWVIGFSHIFKPEYYNHAQASTYVPYQGMAWTEANVNIPLGGGLASYPQSTQTTANSVAQTVQVAVVDEEWRRQIDDLAHRADPASQLRKPQAERAPLDGPIELNHADGAEDADIDHAPQLTASL